MPERNNLWKNLQHGVSEVFTNPDQYFPRDEFLITASDGVLNICHRTHTDVSCILSKKGNMPILVTKPIPSSKTSDTFSVELVEKSEPVEKIDRYIVMTQYCSIGTTSFIFESTYDMDGNLCNFAIVNPESPDQKVYFPVKNSENKSSNKIYFAFISELISIHASFPTQVESSFFITHAQHLIHEAIADKS